MLSYCKNNSTCSSSLTSCIKTHLRAIVRFYICSKGERLVLKLNGTGIYIQGASLLSLPCSHHSCFHPHCMRLPSPSLGAPLWRLASAAAAAASPAGRRLALPRTQWAWAQRTCGILLWARGRVRQKGRKALQTAAPQNKPALTWAHPQAPENVNAGWQSICFFAAGKYIHLSSLSLLLSATTLSPWFTLEAADMLVGGAGGSGGGVLTLQFFWSAVCAAS